MAQLNKKLSGGLETFFLPSSPEFSAVSSSMARSLIASKGLSELHLLCTKSAIEKIVAKIGSNQG